MAYVCIPSRSRGPIIKRELYLTYALNAAYALSLGISGVMLTFIALDQGLDIAQIGLLSTLSAAAQMGARLPLGFALRFLSDRFVLLVALSLFALSMVFVLIIPGVIGLVLAHFLQGGSRAGFWTASQTHVIRASGTAARGLARSNIITSTCSLIGPLIAGWLAGIDLVIGEWTVLALALAGLAIVLAMTAFPVFNPPKNPEAGQVRSRFGVRFASLGSLAGGAWAVISATYVPIVFTAADWNEVAIGAVIALANGALLASNLFCGRLAIERFVPVLRIGSVLVGLGISGLALIGVAPAVSVALLILSGAGMGTVMTIGPALAAESVHPEERGQAMAITGSYRAGALLGVPLVVTAASLVLPIAPILLVLGIAVGGPAAFFGATRPARGPIASSETHS
ncbi:MFS transporter [Naasia lichenicola]|uniref:MFS transporter n=1 Tax=Naasia lichenicola TaxID=2565933 RepID=A0A4S4FSM3_9MICO|nr:MFS transporter [Naasia lichenicola]THG33308.1 MFS transporter [Naasia lichenicola]